MKAVRSVLLSAGEAQDSPPHDRQLFATGPRARSSPRPICARPHGGSDGGIREHPPKLRPECPLLRRYDARHRASASPDSRSVFRTMLVEPPEPQHWHGARRSQDVSDPGVRAAPWMRQQTRGMRQQIRAPVGVASNFSAGPRPYGWCVFTPVLLSPACPSARLSAKRVARAQIPTQHLSTRGPRCALLIIAELESDRSSREVRCLHPFCTPGCRGRLFSVHREATALRPSGKLGDAGRMGFMLSAASGTVYEVRVSGGSGRHWVILPHCGR
jgi:hypothetical protein